MELRLPVPESSRRTRGWTPIEVPTIEAIVSVLRRGAGRRPSIPWPEGQAPSSRYTVTLNETSERLE